MLRQLLSRSLPTEPRFIAKRLYYHWQIRTGRFQSPEPEYKNLGSYCREGDWVIDIGANVGHYSHRLSSLVGPSGRVFAFEPIPETFALLASNVERFPYRNVTLLNLATSDQAGVTHMTVPLESGLNNLYLSRIDDHGKLPVFGYRIDDFRFPRKINLVKIDVEGHELAVLKGMKTLLETDHPTIIVEGQSDPARSLLEQYSYRVERISGSPNTIFR
jgi:FkbM family methyltransferase